MSDREDLPPDDEKALLSGRRGFTPNPPPKDEKNDQTRSGERRGEPRTAPDGPGSVRNSRPRADDE